MSETTTSASDASVSTLSVAQVWCVDPGRGDLYVVTFDDRDVLVQLLDGGITNSPERVKNEQMLVMLDESTNVIALPVEGGRDGWSRCKRLRD